MKKTASGRTAKGFRSIPKIDIGRKTGSPLKKKGKDKGSPNPEQIRAEVGLLRAALQ